MAFWVKTALHFQFTTQIYSLTLTLICSTDQLLVSLVSEIQALVATQLIHILNFFAPNYGSPYRTQSGIIFSELNFHQEQLVEPFVPGLLGDVVHENKILFECEENDP